MTNPSGKQAEKQAVKSGLQPAATPRGGPICYLYGSETYLIEEETRRIKQEALSKDHGFDSLNYHVYGKESLDAGEIVSVANTMPAFAGKRLVIVKDAQSLSAEDHEIFLEYAKNPSPFTCLVFTAYTYKLVAGSAFIKYLSEKGWVRAFNRLKDHELLAWVKREARKEGKAVSDSAAERLIELGGKNLIDIKGELEKIILFAGEKAAIDDKDVAGAGLDCKEENIFELSDAIGARNLPKALKIYGKLSYEPPVKVLGAISYQIRALLKLKSLLKNHALPSNIAGMLGIPAWKLEDYKRRSRLFTEEELKDAMQKLSSTDVGLKTGRVPQTIGLSKLIIDLCHRG